jgi:hypothetical protein
MKFTSLIGLPGVQSLQVGPYNTDYDTQQWKTGLIIPFLDEYWGGGELLYAQAWATLAPWELCYYLGVNEFFTSDLGGTSQRFTVRSGQIQPANQGNGIPLALAMQNMTLNQYGWFLLTANTAPVTALGVLTLGGAMYSSSSTAGRITTGSSALRHIIRSRCVADGSGANSALATRGIPGTRQVSVRNRNHLFVGQFVSGTGIPGGTTITGFGQDLMTVYLSNALTADPSGTSLSFPLNNGSLFYPFVQLNRSTLRGPAT